MVPTARMARVLTVVPAVPAVTESLLSQQV
jgi:hypothetical protein